MTTSRNERIANDKPKIQRWYFDNNIRTLVRAIRCSNLEELCSFGFWWWFVSEEGRREGKKGKVPTPLDNRFKFSRLH